MYNLLCHKLQALQEIMTGRQKIKLRIHLSLSLSLTHTHTKHTHTTHTHTHFHATPTVSLYFTHTLAAAVSQEDRADLTSAEIVNRNVTVLGTFFTILT